MPVELPLRLRDGDLLVQTRINGSDPLSFKLDTGFGITTVHPDLVEGLKLRRAGQMTIEGIAGEEQADTYAGAAFDLGGAVYEPRRVAVLPSEGRRRFRHRDGILGAGFFRRFVVEIDVAQRQLRLWEPAKFNYDGAGEVLSLQFKHDTPIVEAAIRPLDGEDIPGHFEIDIGCDDCVCFGHEFVAAHRLLEGSGPGAGSVRRGIGGSAEIVSGKLAQLRLGSLVVSRPAANFFLEGSPAGDGQAGHIGLGSLKRFKMFFDYSRKRLILEKA